MSEIKLSKEEWDAAMQFVLDSKDEPETPSPKPIIVKRKPGAKGVKVVPTKDALVLEIPADGGWARRVGTPTPKETKSNEIPNAHPAGTKAPVLPSDPQRFDSDDSSKIKDEIPADGGFASRTGRPTGSETKSKEIPNAHPAGTKSSRTPIDWEAAAAAALKALNYGTDTSKGWGTGKALPAPGPTVWGQPVPSATVPEGKLYDDGRPDGKTTTSTENKSVRTSLAKLNADNEDLNNNGATLPDGSFCIHTVDDLKNAVDKVKNAEQTDPSGKAFHEIKRHIARRAGELGANHIVPADWQLMLAALEEAEIAALEAEIAKKHSAEDRRDLASKGHALPDGSYPIADAEDLKNAITLARSGHGNVSAAKALIRRRAKDLGVPDMAKGL